MSVDSFALVDLTVPTILARQAEKYATKVFLTELRTGRKVTYGELDELSRRVAHGLSSMGIATGMHVALMMGNSVEHLATFLGIGRLGAVAVPLNTAARGSTLSYFLNQSDASTIVLDGEFLPRLEEVLSELTALRRVIVAGNGLAPPAAPARTDGALFSDWQALVAVAPVREAPPAVRCSDLLLLSYTSGTSGPSKGCMVSHAAAFSYGTGYIDIHGYRESDVFYVCLPLFHNNALLAAVGSALLAGASVAMVPRFSVSKYWDDIRASGATITNLLGSMSSFLWSQAESPADRSHSLRLVSMSPTPRNALQFQERFGFSVMSNYGLSDFGMATAFTADSPAAKLGSIGKPRPGIQIRIFDDHDMELAAGSVGEIVLRHDEPWRASTGYYNMPEATANASRNLWFHTGDRGFVDADGYYYFVDRKKDCIRRRGENISSFEVEQVIMTHAAVAEAAVFPVKLETNDEEVGAVVVLKPGAAVSTTELVEHCQKNVPYFMVPRFIQFREELPMTTNNKVEKFKLQRDARDALESFWDREKSGIALRH